MYYSSSTLISVLTLTVSALPNNNPWAPSCKTFTDTFENVPTFLAGTTPVGVDNGVTYTPFSARAKDPATGATGGVIPHSGNNDIVVGITQDDAQIGTVTLNVFGNILASPSKAFDLYSFWFGCSANLDQAQASTAVACVLSVIGFNIAGQEVPVATFSYSPDNAVASPMVLAVLPDSFRLLKNVTLGVAASTATSTATGLWVDDVTHCNYS